MLVVYGAFMDVFSCLERLVVAGACGRFVGVEKEVSSKFSCVRVAYLALSQPAEEFSVILELLEMGCGFKGWEKAVGYRILACFWLVSLLLFPEFVGSRRLWMLPLQGCHLCVVNLGKR